MTAGVAGFGAAGTLTGSIELSTRPLSEFLGRQISTIAASSQLTLLRPDAFIEDSTALGSNSALTGLADIAGSLYLESASVSTTGSVTSSGTISLDPYYGDGGSTLSIGGTLTFRHAGYWQHIARRRPSKVAATALTNTGLNQPRSAPRASGGPGDLAFLLDVTGSAGPALAGRR